MRLVEETTVDGPGFRTAIYAAGCPNRCPGCHNPETWDIGAGRPMSTDELLKAVLTDDFADVTFTGGDPMFQAAAFAELGRKIKQASNKTIWCFSGFTFEECLADEAKRELLETIDVLVDGRFVEALKDTELLFRGSANQRLVDVTASLKTGEIVLFKPF